MKKLSFFLLLISAQLYAQPPQWGFPIDGPGDEDTGNLGVDDGGNVVVVGEFSSVLDVDPDNVDQLLLDPGSAEEAQFVAKYSSVGDLLWAFPLIPGSNSTDEVGVSDVAVFGDGRFYLLLTLSGSIDLSPMGTPTLVTATTIQPFPPLARDRVLVSYAADGSYSWHKRITGDTATISVNGLSISGSGDVIVSGSYKGDIDLDDSVVAIDDSLHSVPGAINSQGFFVRYGSDGSFQWAIDMDNDLAQLNAFTSSQGDALFTTLSVYMTGGTVDIDPGPGSYPVDATSQLSYLVRYGIDLIPQWAVPLSTSSLEQVVASANGETTVLGFYENSLDLGDTILIDTYPGPAVNFIAHYSPDGAFQWAKNIPNGLLPAQLSLDPWSDVVVSFAFYDPIDLDGPGSDPIAELTPMSGVWRDQGFVWYSEVGAFLTAWRIGDPGGYADVRDLALDNEGNLVITGTMFGTLDFDPGLDQFPLTVPITPDSSEGGYLVRYAPIITGQSPNPALTVKAAFPNPFASSITISVPSTGFTSVTVTDFMGQVVRRFGRNVASSVTWDGRTTSGTEVPPGMYLVTVIADGQRYTQRVIKQ